MKLNERIKSITLKVIAVLTAAILFYSTVPIQVANAQSSFRGQNVSR